MTCLQRRWRRLQELHSDERGSISLASVFALMLLVMLLGMVSNAGQQVDTKIKAQDAADAATWSGGVVLARSMNNLAFTNHLLSDVFALTAFLREGRDQNAYSLVSQILDNWDRVGPAFSQSPVTKFAALGDAITDKVPLEREMVRTFSEWASAASEIILPVLEDILAQEQIPVFQRDLVRSTPEMVQYAVDEVAKRHGLLWPRAVELRGVMWRTIADPVGGAQEQETRTLPVVDPEMDDVPNRDAYRSRARRGRDRLAYQYLSDWNGETLLAFDVLGKMSQFSNLWRIFTCGQLKHLLEVEYPETNLPHVIRRRAREMTNDLLEEEFMFVGVVYREKREETIPGVFKNNVPSDQQAFAQVMMYIPRRRLIWGYRNRNPDDGNSTMNIGGVPGQTIDIPIENDDAAPTDAGDPERVVVRQGGGLHPTAWDLWNETWCVQMAPGTAQQLLPILTTQPSINGIENVDLPQLQGLTNEDVRWLSQH